jgi:hypothetical protein
VHALQEMPVQRRARTRTMSASAPTWITPLRGNKPHTFSSTLAAIRANTIKVNLHLGKLNLRTMASPSHRTHP